MSRRRFTAHQAGRAPYEVQIDAMIEAQYGMTIESERKKALMEIQRYILGQAYWSLIQTAINETLLWPWVNDYYESASVEPDKFSITWFDK